MKRLFRSSSWLSSKTAWTVEHEPAKKSKIISSSTVESLKHSLIKLTGLGKSKYFSNPNSRNSTVPVSVKKELSFQIDFGL